MNNIQEVIRDIKEKESEELIFQEPDNRHVIFPLGHHSIWEHYKKHVSTFWTVEEVNLAGDMNDWKNLDEDIREYLLSILAFFAASDGIVCENLLERFMIEVKIPEAKFYYTFQAAMENIHSEMYATLIDTFELDIEKKHRLYNAVQYSEAIGDKARWAMKWIGDEEAPFVLRLLAFIIVEGVFFSSSFAGIFWVRYQGLGLPGLVLSNDFISRDEGLHTDFGVEIYRTLKNRLPQDIVHQIFKEAVEVEIKFTDDILPKKLKGMNSDLMGQYVKYVADRLCNQLGYDKIYESKNPFGWMENISVQGKSNFFERTVSEYKVGNNASTIFGMLEDF